MIIYECFTYEEEERFQYLVIINGEYSFTKDINDLYHKRPLERMSKATIMSVKTKYTLIQGIDLINDSDPRKNFPEYFI